MYVDTHAHLQEANFDSDREEVLKRAKDSNVDCIINIGTYVESSVKAIDLAKKYPNLYATVGIHPHYTKQFNEGKLAQLRKLSAESKVVAIGEIGLDYFRNLSPITDQKKAFIAQVALAQEVDLPVVIHDRDAHQDIYDILSEFKGKIRGVLHCYTGNWEMANKFLELGFLISFAGNLTYPKALVIHETARKTDLNKIIIETDCPWLTPQTWRGKRNEPSYVPSTAYKIAELKGENIQKIAAVTSKNAKDFFKLNI